MRAFAGQWARRIQPLRLLGRHHGAAPSSGNRSSTCALSPREKRSLKCLRARPARERGGCAQSEPRKGTCSKAESSGQHHDRARAEHPSRSQKRSTSNGPNLLKMGAKTVSVSLASASLSDRQLHANVTEREPSSAMTLASPAMCTATHQHCALRSAISISFATRMIMLNPTPRLPRLACHSLLPLLRNSVVF